MQIFLTSEATKAYGVEIHQKRCRNAAEATSLLAKSIGPTAAYDRKDDMSAKLQYGVRELSFTCGDLREELGGQDATVNLRRVTIVLSNSILFPSYLRQDMQILFVRHLLPGSLFFHL
eukprot:gnl/MRDRNA2_/MRDRNA2_50270_c0_seq1.p3 gnl/MRDRNA2_/MRDRNA2_50270_c0~~gnl/MRDRNA2_/MRDRNA2_50270_c0_seq1.p3  ORF type:complete len:118 (-),score=19.11 gnl/MRDRNA2_/MRDRNA2_50270_c0_seq1:529-882(-)